MSKEKILNSANNLFILKYIGRVSGGGGQGPTRV